jgi:hypothetical protein
MGRLITGNIDGVMDYMHSLAATNNNLSQGQLAFLLRLSVHIVLVMRDLEIPHDQAAANEIIGEYIHVLMHYHVVSRQCVPTNSRMIRLLSMHTICRVKTE